MNEHLSVIAQRRVEDLRERQKDPEKYKPLSTGIPDLDNLVGGIVRPSYVGILGMAKRGKSSMAVHLAMTLGQTMKVKVLFYQLEELKWQFADRALVAASENVDRTKIRDVVLSSDELDELDAIAKSWNENNVMLYVDDQLVNIETIGHDAINNKAGLIVVDTANLLTGGKGDRLERLDYYSARFKDLRNRYGIGVIALFQLNEKTNRAYGSSAVYKDADLVLTMEQAMDEELETEIPGMLDIRIDASRQSGTGKLTVAFDGSKSRFGKVYTETFGNKTENFGNFNEHNLTEGAI